MCKTLVWGLRTILCVGLILVGIGPLGLAQSTDDSGGEENQLANNKIVQILLSKYGDKYGVTEDEIKIEEYRVTHKLGYGEILILYALADRILEDGILEEIEDEETGIDGVITKILDQRANKGWGQIAQEYGLKLGPVVSSVRKKGKEKNGETGQGGGHKQGKKNEDTEEGGGDYNQGNKNDDTQQGGGDYNQGKQNDDTQQGGGDHKLGKKNKGKNNKGHPGKGKGGGKGKGKK